MSIAIESEKRVNRLTRIYGRLYDSLRHIVNRGQQLDRHFIEHHSTYDERRAYSENRQTLHKAIREQMEFDSAGHLEGPLRSFAEEMLAQGPLNLNTMDAGLLRQIFLNLTMRAFRRRLVPLRTCTTVFERVPMAGTDKVEVPYYPLDVITSNDFVATAGYSITPGAQTLKKEILVGGVGGAKIPGCGRKYKGLAFSAFEYARQPFLNVEMLSVLAGEQLAFDIINDVISANVLRAYFGDNVWLGPPQAFSIDPLTAMESYANRADWPESARSLVLDSSYMAALATDTYVKTFLNIGSKLPIQAMRVGRLLSFDTYQNPRIPATTDGTLAGWISMPNAILFASAPIIEGPGAAKRMLARETIIDDESGLSLTYKYWGDPMVDTDYEVIESAYGSAPGELAALKRLVATGL